LHTSDALRIRAEAEPDREIFRCGEGALTYGQWHRRSSALAQSFISQGVRQRELVILSFSIDQWINYVIALLAVQKAGAVAVSLSSDLSGAAARKIIHQTAALHSVSRTPFPGVHALDCADLPRNHDWDFRAITDDPATIAEIVVTSGSTGLPKLVACPHGNLTQETLSADQAAEKFQNRTVQFLTHPPIGSNAAQRKVVNALRGTRFVYNIPSEFDGLVISQWLVTRRIEEVALVPAKAVALLRACQGRSFSQISQVHLGSARTPTWVADGLSQLFPNAVMLNEYGLTEGGRFRIGGIYDPRRPSWVGYPEYGQSNDLLIRITDDRGNELPTGTPGKLWIRDTTSYPRFYYGIGYGTGGAHSAGGWMCTNDIAILEGDGSVTLVERTGEIANVSGLKVSLLEIEDEVTKLDCVLDCAAFIVPHRTTGDMIGMGIVNQLNDRVRLEQAKSRLSRELGYRFPRLWIRVPEIPRTFTGKVDRKTLSQLAMSQFPELSVDQG
jgi:acyl-CoA synthetase (AMP-forming)/AMP-acid ligase II